ncbi:MAG: 1-deoxy-D-xylulose-5-phosphate reductoisomerase [Akkermansia sp.]|nr:1-deoxy-D-xylulose-5-phosphate reductoisomerase [Akkermansia sp.]
MKRKKVVILGSTGSIGTSALKVARDIPERMEVVGLAAHSSVDALVAQAVEFGVKEVCIFDSAKAAELQRRLPAGTRVLTGLDGLCELATLAEADMVLVSIIGTAGLKPTLQAIEAGKDLAIASKEILVMAGEVVMNRAAARGINVLPVDSEHNAIYQCLQGHKGGAEQVSRLILTASGGPFRTTPREKLAEVTLEQALNHPTWKMGRKITIDSATLFNKGLEMIEARWLFGIPMERVDVIVHPQSIVHSLVEYQDGSILAQLSSSDMCFPIQYAVTWPDRTVNSLKKLDLAQIAALRFEAPRWDDFPALNLARQSGLVGGTMPAMFNAANEEAVQAFVDGKLGFTGIWETVETVLSNARPRDYRGQLDMILEDDAWAREEARRVIFGK